MIPALSTQPTSASRDRQLHSEGVEYLPYCVVADVGTWRESFVQALSAQSCVLGHLRDATRLSYIRYGMQKDIGIPVFQRGPKVFSNDRPIIQILGGIKRSDSQSSLSLGHLHPYLYAASLSLG